jgi:hypothetical protein
MAGQLTEDKLDFMILGTGGKGSTNVGFLTDYGIKTIWLVPDHPAKTGDEYAKGVLKNKNNIDKVTRKHLSFKIFTWPIAFQGFDLDEAVKLNGYDVISNYLFVNRLGYFINDTPWVTNKCNEEILRVKQDFDSRKSMIDENSETYAVEVTNIDDERRKKIKDVILSWYQYISDPTDKQSFILTYTKTEGIELDKIESINTSMYSLDTFQGVAKKVHSEVSKYFSPAYKRTKSIGDVVCLWAKQDRAIVEITGSDKNTFELIAMYAGMPITNWFNDLLGQNEVYLSGVEGKNPLEDERTKRRNAKDIMLYVWELMLPGLKNINDLHKISQGIHYYKLPSAIKYQDIMYFVNGKYVFKGKFVDIGVVDWELVDNAVDNGILFDKLATSEQWSSVEDISDLYDATKVNLKDVYLKVREILDQWTFKYDETIKDYLAAYVMSIPVMAAIGDVNITFVTGDAESGKTSLIYGLLGGKYGSSGVGTIPPILEAADASTDATAASMYQTFDCKTLLCVLDEIDQNKYKSKNQSDRTMDLQKQMYSIPMGGSSIKRGGVTRDLTERYYLNMPIIMAGTTVPVDTIFLSRIFVVYTKKVPGKKLDYYISQDDLVQLRKSITIGLIPYLPTLVSLRQQIAKKLMTVGKDIATLSTRFMECLLTPLTIYQFIGIGNAEELYLRVLEYYKDRLNMLHGTDVQSDLINMCLYTERIKILNDSGVTDSVSARSLILNGQVSILNNANCGVYYLPEKEWIIIVWRQVKYTLLMHSSFTLVDETAMFELATKTPFTQRDISEEDHLYISNELGLADVKARTSYSVVDVRYMIRDDLTGKGKKCKNTSDSDDIKTVPVAKVEEHNICDIVEISGTDSITVEHEEVPKSETTQSNQEHEPVVEPLHEPQVAQVAQVAQVKTDNDTSDSVDLEFLF